MKDKISIIILFITVLFVSFYGADTEINSSFQQKRKVAYKQKLRGKIKIGAILPRKSNFSAYGKSIKKGIDLAVRETNDEGGVRGKKLVVLYKKSSTEDMTTKAFNKLSKRVSVIIGPIFSDDGLAIADLATEEKIVVVSPTATSPEMTGASPYFFRTVGSDVFQGKALSNTIKDVLLPQEDPKEIAVLYIDNVYGSGLKDEFLKNYDADKVLSTLSFTRGDKDFKAQLTQVQTLGIDLVVLISYANEGSLILQQAASMNLNLTWICSDGFKTDRLLKKADKFGTNRVLVTFPMTMVPNDATEVFSKLWQKRYPGDDIDAYAAYGYDAVKVIVEGFLHEDYPVDGIRETLTQVQYNGVTGMKVFNDDGDCPAGYDIWEIKDSKWEVIARMVP